MKNESVVPIVDTWHERVPKNGVLNETWHDRRNQDIASKTWADHFKCDVHTYPQLWPVDCYAFKGKRVLCMLELKGASRVRGVGYLNFRKYFNMLMATRVSDNFLQGIFCIYDPDGLHYIDIRELGKTYFPETAMVGYQIIKSQADIEPAFMIKKEWMKTIKVYKQIEINLGE